MTKPELQAQILKGNKLRHQLVSAIDKIPESETRGELIYKHDKVAQKLAGLYADLEDIDGDTCYFGFTDKCPGHHCADCGYYNRDFAKQGELWQV